MISYPEWMIKIESLSSNNEIKGIKGKLTHLTHLESNFSSSSSWLKALKYSVYPVCLKYFVRMAIAMLGDPALHWVFHDVSSMDCFWLLHPLVVASNYKKNGKEKEWKRGRNENITQS